MINSIQARDNIKATDIYEAVDRPIDTVVLLGSLFTSYRKYFPMIAIVRVC